MIQLENNVINLNCKIEQIKRFEVWFETPFGLYQDVEKAKENLKANDIPVDFGLWPRCVAVSDTMYEIIKRG